jgi:Transglutaminase-like superfamily
MERIRKFLRRSWAERVMLLEALAWLCWARLLLVAVPFRRIAPHLGRQMAESPATLAEAERAVVSRVSWSVLAVSRHSELGFVCLPQAMAAKWMLRRRGLPSTLYLGLRHDEKASLTAHAWLRVGDRILTGQAEARGHQVIASFGD